MTSLSPGNSVVLACGFRPFFLLAGLWAVVPAAGLIWALSGGAWPAGAIAPLPWHGHEMLLGFAAAAIAGFLLTAVPSWTGTQAVSGYTLAGLVALWVVARVVALMPDPATLAVALALAFFPALAFTLARPLVVTRNVRNLPFLVLLALLFLAELLFLAPRAGWFPAPPFDPLRLAINTIVLMVAIVGGRIIPAFTRNALAARGRPAEIRASGVVDAAAIAAAACVVVGDIVAPGTTASGGLAALAGTLLGLRLRGWRSFATRDVPLLWVLHAGYAWLALGLVLKAVWLLGGLAAAQHWQHAITMGSFGAMILGVTTRAALGHTGRPLAVGMPIVAAYALVCAAALLRVFGPWLVPGRYVAVLAAAAAAWCAAFLLYLAVYAPILLAPRVDGQPG